MKPLSRIALVMGIMMVVLGIVLAKIQPGPGSRTWELSSSCSAPSSQ